MTPKRQKKNYVSLSNGNLRLPANVYKVEGNFVNVRKHQRTKGDVLAPVPSGHPFNPHWGQMPIWYDRKTRNQILIAGSQGGKSHIGPYWLWREIEEVVAKGGRDKEYLFGIIAPTLQMQRQATVGIARMVRFLEKKFDCTEDAFLNKQDLKIDLRGLGWPVYIYSGSAERRHRLQGARLEAAWIDEAANVRDVGIVHVTEQRLYGKGRLLITTTPYMAGAQWLKQRIERVISGEDESTMAVRFPSVVNPYFSLESEANLRASLPPWYFRMMYEAEFEQPQGLVYQDVTYIEPFSIPRHWTRIIGIDPTHGGEDEFAAVWIAYDPLEPETWYLYREFYLPCKPKIKSPDDRWRAPHEMLDMIYAMSQVEEYGDDGFHATDEREHIERIFTDPSKPETLHYVQNQFQDSMVFKANPKLDGLFSVGSMLKTGRLLVFNNLINWAFEQHNYIYPTGEFGESIGEVPMDRNNHLMDAMRYAVYQSDESRNSAEPSFG